MRFFWAASYGQIYPELRRLEAEGLIEGEDVPTGDRRRVVYRLTEAGEEVLAEWLRSPGTSIELRDEGLLKLLFANSLSDDERLELIASMRAEHEAVIERLREIESMATQRGGSPQLVHSYGIGLHGWAADWLGEAEQEVGETSAANAARRKTA